MTTKGLLVRIQSKSGQQGVLENLLRDASPGIREEAATVAWFATRSGRSDYVLFHAFSDETAREAYFAGAIATTLMGKIDTLLEDAPEIQRLDILAHKLPATLPMQPDSKALLLTFKAQEGHQEDVETFLRDGQAFVLEEPETTAWFAIRLDSGVYGIFDTFPDNGGRLKHLVGHVPRELAKQALHLLGSMPDMEMLDTVAEKVGGVGA